MEIKLNKLLSIPVALMILLAVTVVPTMACSPTLPCADPNNKATMGSIKYLVGDEKEKSIGEAIQNEKVSEVVDKLENNGYSQVSSIAAIIPVTTKNGTEEYNIVAMSFQNETGTNKSIMYAINSRTGEKSLITTDFGVSPMASEADCAFYLAILVSIAWGCVGICVGTLGIGCVICLFGYVGTGYFAGCACSSVLCQWGVQEGCDLYTDHGCTI